MNLASALIYRVLEEQDFDTWTNVRKHYLPNEYHQLFEVIEKHTENFHKLPTVEELKLEVRDGATLDKVYALEGIETEAEPHFLLEAVKNEYAQREALFQLDRWVDRSIAFETAEEVVRHIQQIGIELEDKVDLIPPEQSMQKINLFDSDEEVANRITLGFNKDFDERFQFNPTDYIMIGGKRGHGKSLTCSNVANTIVERKKKALYFSIEMEPRQVLQRACSIATGIPFSKIRQRDMDVAEWEKVVAWWATRYQDGGDAYEAYLKHRSFEKFHQQISKHPMSSAYVDVVYDPNMTLGKVSAEINKRMGSGEYGIWIVDYINKVKRTGGNHIQHMDWQEQISISHAFKTLAQDSGVPLLSPYQIDAQGEARFAKGILDSPDAAFILTAHKGETPCMTFNTTKMRGADDEEEFTSTMNWSTLKIGPDSAEKPRQENKKSGREHTSAEISVKTGGIYDN